MAVFLPLSFACSLPLSFSPTSISGLSLWLDASDSSTVTGTSSVTKVKDKSANNVNLSNASNFAYPNNTFNGTYPSFYQSSGSPSGNATLGYNASFNLTAPFTVFAVAQQTNSSTYGYIIDAATGSGRDYIYNKGLLSPMGGNAATDLASSPFQVCVIFSSSGVLYTNGTSQYTGSFTGTTSGTTIGNRYTLNESWPGHICEILIYSGAFSTTQQQQIEGYLAWKWGLQGNLPSTHAYKKRPP